MGCVLYLSTHETVRYLLCQAYVPTDIYGVESLRKSAGALFLQKSTDTVASLYKSKGPVSLYEFGGAVSLFNSIGIAPLHNRMDLCSCTGQWTLHFVGSSFLQRIVGAVSLS